MADQDTTTFDFVQASQQLDESDRVPVTDETVADPISESPATPATPVEAAVPEGGAVTRDGKHTIPFEEVAETRRQNADLRATVAKLTEQLVATTTQVRELASSPRAEVADATEKVAAAAAEAQATGGSVEEAVESALAEVIAEAPWMEPLRNALNPLAKTSERVQSIDERLARIEAREKALEQATVKEQQQTVEQAIAKVPIIAFWQANGGEAGAAREAFEYAAMIDKKLRESPEWQGKPMDERFREVQNRVVGVLGQECVPEKLRGNLAPVSKDQVMAAANAKLAQAAGGNVTTLSDIPGGTPAAASMAAELAADDVPLNRLEQHFQSQRNPIDAFQQALRTLN